MRQTVAVIGTGENKRTDLIKLLSTANCRVLVYSKDPSAAAELINEVKKTNTGFDAEVMDCKVDASWESDVILIALPDDEIGEAALQIKQVACQKIILTFNSSISEKLKPLLPHSKIININADFEKNENDAEVLECLLNLNLFKPGIRLPSVRGI